MKEHDFSKYLKRNPGKLLPELEKFPHAVIVPAYDETEYLPRLLSSLSKAEIPAPIAVITVVNHPAGTGCTSSLELLAKLEHIVLPPPLKLFTIYAPQLKHGVGEARKIGFDLFARSRNCENAETSLMFSLDSDCTVHKEYFSATLNAVKEHLAGCAVIAVAHQKPQDNISAQAIETYEQYLLDYEKKLSFAGSPYAFNAIGSGFAVTVSSYIKCGGMKLKKAGEDFYFIQDAVKCTKVIKVPSPLVYPSARISERVPFGTGTAIRDIIGGTMPRAVTDDAFSELKKVLETISIPGALDSGEKFVSMLMGRAADFFVVNGFNSDWNRITGNQKFPDTNGQIRAFHLWFDALQTRRFLHYLSESETL